MARTTDHAFAEIRQLCSMGIPIGTIASDLASSLQNYLPSRHVVYTLPDRLGRPARFLFPTCTLTNESALDVFADTEGYMSLERSLDTSFDSLMHTGRPLRNSADYGSKLRNTPIFDQVFRPLGLNSWMRSAIRRNGRGVGMLFLSRPEGEPAYSSREEGRLEAVLPYLAHALGVADGAYVEELRPGDDEGLMIVDRQGRLLHACPTAQLLRRMITYPQGVGGPDVKAMWDARLQALAQTMTALHNGDPTQGPPVWYHENPWGRFELRCRPLFAERSSSTTVAVHLRRYRPPAIRMARALSGYSLSLRQRELCLLLSQGARNEDIAAHMGLRPNTVAGMVKEVYRKMGVNSRGGLRETLLQGNPTT